MQMNDAKLYQMNPRERFSNRVEDYVKYRPSYPSEAIDRLLDGLNEEGLIAADIGAGTGISSRLLGDRGIRVLAIEPNPSMRLAAASHPFVEFRQGSAEKTELPNESMDLVTCFQSFHWFAPEPTLQEFWRILKPKGRLAVVWNDRDREDEFTRNYTHLVQVASDRHPAESCLQAISPLENSSLFSGVRSSCFSYRQSLDEVGLIGRAMSVSYIPKTGAKAERFITGLKELYAQFCDERGLIDLVYKTNVYLA
ncbi:MAG: class I SAM-dependent methyltransferase [Cyanobacteria bacterium SBLK]|nr:class I SAM-dependent methyltransferase [Cyanobacteria bacterium SBLK]